VQPANNQHCTCQMSVWVGLLLVVVTPGLMISILLLSILREMRHDSSAVVLMVEIESSSGLAFAVFSEWVLAPPPEVELLSARAPKWLPERLMLLLLLSAFSTPGVFWAVSGVAAAELLWFLCGVRNCFHMQC